MIEVRVMSESGGWRSAISPNSLNGKRLSDKYSSVCHLWADKSPWCVNRWRWMNVCWLYRLLVQYTLVRVNVPSLPALFGERSAGGETGREATFNLVAVSGNCSSLWDHQGLQRSLSAAVPRFVIGRWDKVCCCRAPRAPCDALRVEESERLSLTSLAGSSDSGKKNDSKPWQAHLVRHTPSSYDNGRHTSYVPSQERQRSRAFFLATLRSDDKPAHWRFINAFLYFIHKARHKIEYILDCTSETGNVSMTRRRPYSSILWREKCR